ncbi:hypothetical protein ACFLYF_04480 [Chloroflexota bacterium]
MRLAIILGCTELKIVVNPAAEITREINHSQCLIPWLYAPWPELGREGMVESETQT